MASSSLIHKSKAWLVELIMNVSRSRSCRASERPTHAPLVAGKGRFNDIQVFVLLYEVNLVMVL